MDKKSYQQKAENNNQLVNALLERNQKQIQQQCINKKTYLDPKFVLNPQRFPSKFSQFAVQQAQEAEQRLNQSTDLDQNVANSIDQQLINNYFLNKKINKQQHNYDSINQSKQVERSKSMHVARNLNNSLKKQDNSKDINQSIVDQSDNNIISNNNYVTILPRISQNRNQQKSTLSNQQDDYSNNKKLINLQQRKVHQLNVSQNTQLAEKNYLVQNKINSSIKENIQDINENVNKSFDNNNNYYQNTGQHKKQEQNSSYFKKNQNSFDIQKEINSILPEIQEDENETERNQIKRINNKLEKANSAGKQKEVANGASFFQNQNKKYISEDLFLQIPEPFIKKNYLGRGTYATSWLVQDKFTSKIYAAKRILLTETGRKAFQNEINFYQFFFSGQDFSSLYQNHAGIYKIPKIHKFIQDDNLKQGWIINEYCGQPLSKQLYSLKKETINGEYIYKIYPKMLYKSMVQHLQTLKDLIIDIAKVIDLMSQHLFVHSDLRIDNIMVKTIDYGDCAVISETKIIDFSSTFNLNKINGVSQIIPEYMAPELLLYILKENQGNQTFYYLDTPWAIDVWSLGCTIIEILMAVPLWMPYRCMVNIGQEKIQCGLFAAKDRAIEKVYEKQLKMLYNFKSYIGKLGFCIQIDDQIEKILFGIFKLNPRERISPKQIIDILSSK